MADLADWAIEAAIAAAASSAAAATGVGLIGAAAGAAVVAQRVFTMINRYEELLTGYGHIMKAITLLYGAGVGSMANTVDALKSFPVPGRGYDNPVA